VSATSQSKSEPVSDQSQEREFPSQRRANEVSEFGRYLSAETMPTEDPGVHVFDISAVLQVSLSHHN
jgi:hypothetical protein